MGGLFFGKLIESLTDKSKTEKLVNSLINKDSTTGESFIQIPIKNSETVETGLKLIAQLFSSFNK